MAVTLTQSQLMSDLGLTADRADNLLLVATDLVTRYAPAAPDALMDEAALRCAGWLSQQPYASVRRESQGGIDTSYNPMMHSALRHSGAMALLTGYKRRRAGAI